jgi:hypothetical protein
VGQKNKAKGVNVTPITVVDSIYPELLENFIDIEKINADSIDDCTDECVMEYLKSTKDRDASVTAEFFKAKLLAKVSIIMSEKNPALRVTKVIADNYTFRRNLRLDFINGKPKKEVRHLVSVIRSATAKALIESKLGRHKSELMKDILEFVAYLETMAIKREEHGHVVDHKKTGNFGSKDTGKNSDAGG